VLQRIEEYKEQLSRTELLAIADEAVRELEVSAEEQLVLTEVLGQRSAAGESDIWNCASHNRILSIGTSIQPPLSSS
jgi:hypothetical protein